MDNLKYCFSSCGDFRTVFGGQSELVVMESDRPHANLLCLRQW
uniref:Uncharacterized protein n=1 Tax=Anguilla anguilla TaxID=7936 RepID=A0A0E9R4S3_ANGAN